MGCYHQLEQILIPRILATMRFWFKLQPTLSLAYVMEPTLILGVLVDGFSIFNWKMVEIVCVVFLVNLAMGCRLLLSIAHH